MRTSFHVSPLADEFRLRADQLVDETLMITFAVVMHGELGRCATNRAFAKQDQSLQQLSHVEQRVVNNDYTISFASRRYQLAREQVKAGMRGKQVRIELHLSGTLRARFEGQSVEASECGDAPAPAKPAAKPTRKDHNRGGKSDWIEGFFERPGPELQGFTNAIGIGSTIPSWRSGKTHGSVTGGHSPIASEPTPSPRLWAAAPGATPALQAEHITSGLAGHSKPELSTLLQSGTFYFALTCVPGAVA